MDERPQTYFSGSRSENFRIASDEQYVEARLCQLSSELFADTIRAAGNDGPSTFLRTEPLELFS
jgi:hypothetical protein